MSEKIYNMVDLETIEKLADIVAAKELGEITIADGEKYITVKGKKCPMPLPLAGAPVAASPAVSAAAPAAPAEVPEGDGRSRRAAPDRSGGRARENAGADQAA